MNKTTTINRTLMVTVKEQRAADVELKVPLYLCCVCGTTAPAEVMDASISIQPDGRATFVTNYPAGWLCGYYREGEGHDSAANVCDACLPKLIDPQDLPETQVWERPEMVVSPDDPTCHECERAPVRVIQMPMANGALWTGSFCLRHPSRGFVARVAEIGTPRE